MASHEPETLSRLKSVEAEKRPRRLEVDTETVDGEEEAQPNGTNDQCRVTRVRFCMLWNSRISLRKVYFNILMLCQLF